MAKYNPNAIKKKEEKKVYPSDFGSHLSMVSGEYPELLYDDKVWVVCSDDRGYYVTEKKNLDTGLCDYNRSVNTEARDVQFADLVMGEKDVV